MEDGLLTPASMADSGPESRRGASLRLGRFFFPILRGRTGFERAEKPNGDARYFLDCAQEGIFIGLGRFVKATIFLTNCSEAARTSSSVTGGSKLKRVLMFRHIHYDLKYQNVLRVK